MTGSTTDTATGRPLRWGTRTELPEKTKERTAELRSLLFGAKETKHEVYALLDAAGIEGLPTMLQDEGVPHCCLFSGRLPAGVPEHAPYLARLSVKDAFTERLLAKGWGESWGVYAVLPGDVGFRDVRKHFRTFLMVRGPGGKALYFRYYDPRVFRVYLPTCEPNELEHVFGPVERYIMESETGQNALTFARKADPEC